MMVVPLLLQFLAGYTGQPARSIVESPSDTPPADGVLSLNGEWSFATDEADEGMAERWWEPTVAAQRLTHRLGVPGTSIGAAGFGNATALKHHEYTGVSWFAKTVAVPTAWSVSGGVAIAATLSLRFGGVKDAIEVWEGGKLAGNHSGFMDGFEIDLSSALASGVTRLELVARVHSATSCSMGGCFASDNSGRWTGIWGDVELVHRPALTLDNLTVRLQSLDKQQRAAKVSVTASLGNGAANVAASLIAGAKTTSSLSLELILSEHDPTQAFERGALVLHHRQSLETAMLGQTARNLGQRQQLSIEVELSAPKLWSPMSPSLYHADLRLISGSGEVVDASVPSHTRFGLRQMKIQGPFFVLNGKRHGLWGTGDDFGYALTEGPPMNKSVYLERLGAMRQYGFDFIRLHSHFEAMPFFEAADELGMFVSPALPAGGCHDVALRTWEWQINALRNTPSVMDVNMANEAYGLPPKQLKPGSLGGWPGAPYPYRKEFYTKAKQMRPELHVLDTDGCCWAATDPHKSKQQVAVDMAPICPLPHANGSCAGPTNDFMTPSFGITTPMVYPEMYSNVHNHVPCIGNGTSEEQCAPPKPLVSHEMGNFGTFPDIAREIAAMSKTNLQVDMHQAVLDSLHARGFTLDRLASFVNKSNAHAYFCWKATVEFLRLAPYVTGHSWWLFQDILGGNDGLVDYMYQPKTQGGALTPARIRQFIDPVVVLVSNGTFWKLKEQDAVFASGELLQPKLRVSNFFPSTLSNCSIEWSFSDVTHGLDSSKNLSSGVIIIQDVIDQGVVYKVHSSPAWRINAGLSKPMQFRLAVRLSCTELTSPRVNDWTAWAYPTPAKTTVKSTTLVFASPKLLAKVKTVIPTAQPFPVSSPWSIAALYIAAIGDTGPASQFGKQLEQVVAAGARLLVAQTNDWPTTHSPSALMPFHSTLLMFHSPWWTIDSGTPTGLGIPGNEPNIPAGIRNLATHDGRLDDAFFPALGPLPGACDGYERAGTSFNVHDSSTQNVTKVPGMEVWAEAIFGQDFKAPAVGGTTAAAPSNAIVYYMPFQLGHVVVSGLELELATCAKPIPVGACHETAYPYANKHPNTAAAAGTTCWKTAASASAGSGGCGDWCLQNVSYCSAPNPGCGCGCPGPDCYLHCCNISCPAAYPYPDPNPLGSPGFAYRGVLCYNDSKWIAAGGGPCGSWCTRDPKVGAGCGSTSQWMCPDVLKQCEPYSPPSPPPPPLSPPPPGWNTTHEVFDSFVLKTLVEATLALQYQGPPPFPLVTLDSYVESHGARGLDGSPQSIYVQQQGMLLDSFIIDFEGGGWCYGLEDCASRAKGMGKPAPTCPFQGGFLSADRNVNPDFANWTKVFVNYLDGFSFTGDLDTPIHHVATNQTLYFRGKRNLIAVFDALAADYGLRDAKRIIISGNSAGGLTVFLHLDQIAAMLKTLAPDAEVIGFPDGGYFLDAANTEGEFAFRSEMNSTFLLSNGTSGIDPSCKQANLGSEWRCMFAQYVFPHLTTKLFALESQYDAWQLLNILQLHDPTGAGAVPFLTGFSPTNACLHNNTCIQRFQGYGKTMRGAFAQVQANAMGVFFPACIVHCEATVDGANAWSGATPHHWSINNRTVAQAFGDCYFGRGSCTSVDESPWPSNPSCL